MVDSAFTNYVSACKTMKMIIQETHSHLILRYTFVLSGSFDYIL